MTSPPNRATRAASSAAFAAVAAGALLGTLARVGISTAWPHESAGFPWATLLINVAGSLLAGLAVGSLQRRPGASPLLRPFAVTGVLGSFTTYSAFAVETNALVGPRPGAAALYVGLTLAGGTLAAAAGLHATAGRP